ncbi:hypothetical protein I6F65_21180 [Pseudoalteromonas sp. SWXJZ94C]|uniref:hypothetical protein n=1 Tax=Pseudoalteromonas sp. SWXJZ94C TaxID=2792065 RepID=UPI0018CD3550|nr:hypothetical protein [Pseudoalteromonas sp. SWXJZ94C]MBH0059449.1 hypothetical protein [Pseudoalteromonas sp. SWXJZ94C]
MQLFSSVLFRFSLKTSRGVARLKANNDTADLTDLYEANEMSTSTMVSHNLTRAKEELAL